MHVSSTADRAAFATPSLREGYAARPPRSPARLAAEGTWTLIWHGGRLGLAGLRRVRLARLIARERAALAKLSPDELIDLGIEYDVARRECVRSWLDVPPGRLYGG